MIHTWRIIYTLFFLSGMLFFGCTSYDQNHKEITTKVNQVDNAGIKQGPWESYVDTVLISRGIYVDGKPDGLWTYWYSNGKMKEEGHYGRGVKEGIWVEWYPDGTIMWKGEWENGSRHIQGEGAQVQILFSGQDHPDHVLARDSLYRISIRIQNIPTENLFVEVNKGWIKRVDNTDLYILETTSDTLVTMAIGYMPDLEFPDFRNLVSEINFKLR